MKQIIQLKHPARKKAVSIAYSFPDYSYDLAGHLISETYPSGKVAANQFDENGDLMSPSDQRPNQQAKMFLDQIK